MIKLKGMINEDKWEAKDGRILLNGKPVLDYEFDRGSDSFWITDPKKKSGQLSFDTKDELIAFAKKSGIRTWKSSVHEDSEDTQNWGTIENVIINFLKANTKILEKRVQSKDIEGTKRGLESIINGLTNARKRLKL